MTLNKKEFLRSELGKAITECADNINYLLRKSDEIDINDINKQDLLRRKVIVKIEILNAYKLAIKQFYGIEFKYLQTQDNYGIVSLDEKEWFYVRPINSNDYCVKSE